MENNIFLIKYYKYDANNNFQHSWTSVLLFFDENKAMIYGKEMAEMWGAREKDGGYYKFEVLEYTPVSKVSEDKEQ